MNLACSLGSALQQAVLFSITASIGQGWISSRPDGSLSATLNRLCQQRSLDLEGAEHCPTPSILIFGHRNCTRAFEVEDETEAIRNDGLDVCTPLPAMT